LRRSLTSLVAIALLALAILPSAADAYIYWGDTGGKIDRTNLDGTAVNQSFIRRGYAEGVAVDALGPTAQPRISLEKDCEAFQDSGASSIDIRLTGFPPFTPFNGRLDLSDGFGYGPVHETTDASGNWESLGPVGSFSPVTWTVTVVWSEGTLTKSLYVDCSKVSVSVKNTALVVAAGPGAKDNLQITRPSRFTVRVTDFPSGAYTGSVVNAGAGCTRSGRYTANCPASGITPALPVLVASGNRPDKVVNSSGLPSSLYGGGGDDLLIGGTANDILKGGPGADVMKGLDGNDLLRANDGASDKLIDCGGGSDFGDLDLLPKDPKVKGCERQTRH
jgi:RTX calcium-binding nonapeptide repeat (4 copies)